MTDIKKRKGMNEKNTKKHIITTQSSETEEIQTSFWTVMTQFQKTEENKN